MNNLHLKKLLFLFLLVFSTFLQADNEPNNDCSNVETIGELNGIFTSATHRESGTAHYDTDRYDYYQFTPASAGNVDMDFNTNKTYNSIWIGSSCDGSEHYSNTDNDTTKNPPSFSVNSGETVYIKIERRWDTTMEYDLDIEFISTTPTCTTLRDTKALTSADNTYVSPVYNDSNWNVGPSATSMNRAYKFSVDSAGEVAISLTDVDQDQAKFSVSEVSCPISLDGLSSTTIDIDSAKDFYVYIYYTNGSHSNIEHRLNVVFTPSVPPSIADEAFNISEVANIGATVGTITNSGGDANSYTINSGGDGKFAIAADGIITLLDTLDYETKTTYTLDVTSTNTEGSSTADITINVIDEDAPTAIDQTFYVDESATNDTLIGTVAASGNPTSFLIVSGNSNNVFKIDNSGNIKVNDNSYLDADTTPQYVLEVEFSNSEGSSDINVTINVEATLPTGDDNTRDFTNVPILGADSLSINGNILLIGNQLLCKNDSDGDTCEAPTVGATNNSINQHKVRIDTSAGAPDNNSWAKLSLEDGTGSLSEPDEVIFARLYWSARIEESTITDAEKNEARTIQIKGPNSSTYTTLTSPVSRFNWFRDGNVFDYSASQDVTAYVQANGSGDYYVGGIKATNGSNKFASWALVVVVANPERELNNVSVYDGFKAVFDSDSDYPDFVTVPASGFLTPVGSEPFKASLFVYSGESESGIDDSAEIQHSSGTWYSLVDGDNDTDDVFNGSIWSPELGHRSNHSGLAEPNFQNVVGTDIDKLTINDDTDPTHQYLNNSQTSTNIKITSKNGSSSDRYTLNMFAFETELHYPSMCYDYTYSQDGIIYTEENDGSQSPYIDIPSNSGNDITVTIYIRSQDNDVDFDHVSIYSDMNTSTVTYNGGFKRTTVNSFGYNSIETERITPLCTEVSYDSNPLCKTDDPLGNFRAGIGKNASGYPLNNSGSMDNNEFMYFTYKLSPQLSSSSLRTPLSLYLDMQYSISSGVSEEIDPIYGIPFGGERMPLCPPSGNYKPEWGIFNVIDTQLNATQTGYSGSRYYNNLLTQVSNRPMSIDVVSLDASTNPPVDPQDINTSVAIEFVDIKGFHDVNISCQEPAVSFSERVHINFSEENRKTVSNLLTPYAKQDATFRIWYIHDGNTSNLISNWTANTDANGNLLSIENLYEQIADAPDVCYPDCGAQTPATPRDADCYECIRSHFGYPLCGRDNFAIRPESFYISLKDSNSSSTLNVANNSNDTSVTLAGGYSYILDINSTNHIDNNSTMGYNMNYLSSTNSDNNLTLSWINNPMLTCDDSTNKMLATKIRNGATTGNDFINNNVGVYSLKMRDTVWTSVDQGTPPHHEVNEFWITNVSDCISNSSAVLDGTHTPLNRLVGCNISSDHTVDRSINGLSPLSYNDLNITFRPYKFNIDNIVVSHGTDLNEVFEMSAPFSYVYMSDIDVESNESLNLIGTVVAEGKNANTLSNFTNNCYGEDLRLTLNTVIPTDGDESFFASRYLDINTTNNSILQDINEINSTIVNMNNSFHDSANGVSSLRVHFNYDRNKSIALNPKQLTINSLDIECANIVNCTMVAEQDINYNNSESRDINSTLNFIYGRTNAPRKVFTGSSGNSLIYFESYCVGCNKSFLPNGSASNSTDDPRWFVNTLHTANDGVVGDITQKNASNIADVLNPTFGAPTQFTLNYNGTRGYPYKATMENNASGWLIYNPYDPNDINNEFEVEFVNSSSDWAGVDGAESATENNASTKTNRRIMW